MLAAADCASGKEEPPPELQMAWDAELFGTPPYSGGRADQPAGLLAKMRKCLNIYNAIQQEKNIPNKNIDQVKDFYESPSGQICKAIKKLREQHG
jgi:hypothetical protein